jgi:chaperonin cofactor prefoldin
MTVTEAQTWTVIGVLAATLISSFGLMAKFGTRLLQQSIGRVLDQIELRFNALDYRFEALDYRFEAIDQRFDALEARLGDRIDALDARITVLDRDVQAIANRVFGGAPASEP